MTSLVAGRTTKWVLSSGDDKGMARDPTEALQGRAAGYDFPRDWRDGRPHVTRDAAYGVLQVTSVISTSCTWTDIPAPEGKVSSVMSRDRCPAGMRYETSVVLEFGLPLL